jgi:Ala-tRNA(Pro) deacylase
MEACLERLKAYLDQHGVKYEIQHHKEAYTIQRVAAEIHETGRHVAKVFIAEVDGKLVMLVLPAHLHVNLDRVKEYLGARSARRAREEQFGHVFPDCDLGAMPPFGNLYQLPVYLDRALADAPHVVFQAGTHTATINIATPDYLRITAPKIFHFALETETA